MARIGNEGFVLWLTGLSGAGKSSISEILERHLRNYGTPVEVLDGDVIRMHLCKDLGFDKTDRDENIRRIGFIADLLSRNGVITIVAAISPYRSTRHEIRSSVQRFVEVYLDCPIPVLIARDTKGMYKKALAGEISHFTGISDPYEPPLSPELVIDTSSESPNQSAARVWDKLYELGLMRIPFMLEDSTREFPHNGMRCRPVPRQNSSRR